MLGRGSADDKGQIHIHLRATEAILAHARGALPVNLKFVFEGEEESSSVHLDDWLEANSERLDGGPRGHLRHGLLRGQPAGDHGRAARDHATPRWTCRDRRRTAFRLVRRRRPEPGQRPGPDHRRAQGSRRRIRVPGFYDDVVALAEEDRAEFAALPFDEDAYPTDLGLPALVGEPGFSTLERRGGRPTLEMNGIWGGFQGEGRRPSSRPTPTPRSAADW